MFNTFVRDSNELSFDKKQRIQMKERLIELNNISMIQLNPWNNDRAKSPLYQENQGFPNFSKLNIKNTAVIKYGIPKQQARKHDNRIIIDHRRADHKNLSKRQSHLIRGRKRLISDDSELQKMSKTISVNNIEGGNMFGQDELIQRRQKVLEKEQKRHRTTISNPMYGKFCINYNSTKQNVPQRKKILSDGVSVKFDNLSMKQIINFRSKMSTLSMDRGDPERAKSIHEVRRRLKSTSQIMKRREESYQIGAHQISLRMDQQLFSQVLEQQKSKQSQEKSKQSMEHIKLSHVKAISPLIDGQKIQQSESVQKFKLGRRKNLYIGFRKFFNHGINTKQKSLYRKQSFPRQIVNLDALMEQGQGDVIRKFQKFEEYAFQKSLNRNTN